MLSFLRSDPKKELRKVLGDRDLPTFPAVAQDALGKIRKSDTSATDIGRTLAQDPALSLAVLKTVNSAAYGVPKKVESVAQAAGLLGLASVESIVLSVAVARSIPSVSTDGFDASAFWEVASWRAAAARALAKELHSARADQSYTGGLLQDMAIPLLADALGTKYTEVLQRSLQPGEDLATLEREAFGWDHAECASWLCADWAIPEFIAACIAGHHGAKIDGLELPSEVSLVCHLRRPNDENDVETLVQHARDAGMDEDRVRTIVIDAADNAKELATVL